MRDISVDSINETDLKWLATRVRAKSILVPSDMVRQTQAWCKQYGYDIKVRANRNRENYQVTDAEIAEKKAKKSLTNAQKYGKV